METYYDLLNETLQKANALMDAAEAHGILCGLLVTAQENNIDEQWLKHVLGEAAVNDALTDLYQQALLQIKKYTVKQLNSPQDNFKPLLLDDDTPLTQRVQTLGGWCEGFLFGLGLSGQQALMFFSDSAREFIQDMVSISRIAPVEEETEEEEIAYTQLVEYIRVGILTLFTESKNHI